jgi:hypothetical protein
MLISSEGIAVVFGVDDVLDFFVWPSGDSTGRWKNSVPITGRGRDEKPAEHRFPEGIPEMKESTFDFLFIVAGLVGMARCIHSWQRSHRTPWLFGIGFFTSFLVFGLREIFLNVRGR